MLPFTIRSVCVKNSGIHGRGLFAKRRIAKGEFIGEYRGRSTMKDGPHVLWVEHEKDEYRVQGIDGKNELRFTNHSEDPNAVFYGEELVALRAIATGEEITFNYEGDVNVP